MQGFALECPIIGCGWHWRHNMRYHCEMNIPRLRVHEEQAPAWDRGPGQRIAFEDGEAGFWGTKQRSRWMDKGVPARRKKVRRKSITSALHQWDLNPNSNSKLRGASCQG